MIGNVDNFAFYAMSHNSVDVLRRRLSSPSVIESVGFIREETESHAHKHFKTMGEGINPVFYAQVVIEHVTVEIAELGCVPL